MSSESHSTGRRPLLVATVVLQVALALILARTYLSGHNTLYNNGNWTSTKAELARGVMGAQSFVYELQPLAGGGLNLAAWHGYQEVMSRTAFDIASVELRFYMERRGYLSVLFQEADGDYAGVRISKNRDYPSMLFTATRDGEFTSRTEIKKLRQFPVSEWQTLRFELDGERLKIFRDEERLRMLELQVGSPLRVGFRGGKELVLVDDIRVEERNGQVFRESFSRPRNWLLVNLVCAAIVLGLSAVLFLALRRIPTLTDTRLLAYLLMFSGVLVVISLMLLGFGTYAKRFYPDQSAKLERQEEYWKDTLKQAVARRLESEYRRPPAQGTRRVIFLGSSQTQGAGAAMLDETLVRQTERLLNELPGEVRFECINTAVSGQRIADMAGGYFQRWIDLEPSIVIVNASNNDIGHGKRQFREWLTRLAERNRELGIELVLVMEPNSLERRVPALGRFHDIMRSVGEEYGLRVVDMHGYLLERYDDGFLWWDWVHLTSFGQRLFAERLVRELSELEDDPA